MSTGFQMYNWREEGDRKSTRLNSSHDQISYAVFCLKKKTNSPFSHENWAKTVGISRYPLLSDVQRSVVKAYGVYWPDWNANVRATFILDKQGKVRFVERYGKGELPQPDKILAEVKKLG